MGLFRYPNQEKTVLDAWTSDHGEVWVHEVLGTVPEDLALEARDYYEDRADWFRIHRVDTGLYEVAAVYVNPAYTDGATRHSRDPKGPELANRFWTRRDTGASYRKADPLQAVPKPKDDLPTPEDGDDP